MVSFIPFDENIYIRFGIRQHMAFVHFGIHSEFSITDSIIRIPELVKTAAADNQVALALTDLSNLYATVKFYKACLNEAIKPIIGSELIIVDDNQPASVGSYNASQHTNHTHVTVLASTQQGYKHLTEVVSLGFTHGKVNGVPTINKRWLLDKADGLIVLLTEKSDVGQALLSNYPEKADAIVATWQQTFADRVYLAIKRTGRQGEDAFIAGAIELANRFNVPLIAHNDVRFLTADDFDAHEARVCIATSHVLADSSRPHDYTAEQYLKTQSQMVELFADIPAVVTNTVELAKRCNVVLTLGNNVLPDFPIPDGDTIETFFRAEAQHGLDRRLDALYPVEQRDDGWQDKRQQYDDRLAYEIGIILEMGFPGYFLIVMDFIRWAKANDVPVGPGRGSGAGSLVAYSLNITDLDPLRYDLLFERFLNPERVSMPDFDIDFCVTGRDRVIEYVAQQYGRDAVSQIITFGTMAAKAVVRDVARVQGKSYGLADKISKLIPKTPGISLTDAVEQEPQLKDLLTNPDNMDYDDATEIWEMALKLEGITRNVGKHAGGVLIAPNKITDFSAIYCDEDGHRVSQFDKDDVEAVGLVKFDFLGLKNLTVIDAAVKSINRRLSTEEHPPIVLEHLPLDDKASYQLLKKAKTTAIFQLESAGMKKYLKNLKPTVIDDVIAMCALYRPGPLDAGMVEMYIDRKHGREQVIYDHPDLEPILQSTYGVIVYQEQVMQISQVMAGYTLGGADMLRRAMGKKKPEEMAKQRVIFVEGATQKGIDEATSGGVFDLMEKFAGYGFNKSHSAAYGVLAYQTAYLKAHYPAEFMAEVMTFDAGNTDNVVFFIDDCRQLGLEVLPPCVNRSNWSFVASDPSTIVYGLGAIKGVGEAAVESLVEARQQGGAFQDLFDFCHRVDTKKVGKRCLEALIMAGAFDCFSIERAALWDQLPEAVQAAEQARQNQEIGQFDLFGEVQQAQKAPPPKPLQWSDAVRLKGEKDTLGLYLTGHPIDAYTDEIKQMRINKLANLTDTGKGNTTWFAGLIVDVANFGNRVVITLDDGSSRLDVSCFPERFNRFKEYIKTETVVIVEGDVRERDGRLFVGLHRILTMAMARQYWLKSIELKLTLTETDLLIALKEILTMQPNTGVSTALGTGIPIVIHLQTDYADATLKLAKELTLGYDDSQMEAFRTLFNPKKYTLHYQKTAITDEGNT